MTLEDFTHPSGWLGIIGTAIGAGGIWKWLSAREAAKPDLIERSFEQSGAMMKDAFDRMEAELSRMAAREKEVIEQLKEARNLRHRLSNDLMALRGWALKVLDHTRQCRAALSAAGIDHPIPPDGLTIEELLALPVPAYEISATWPDRQPKKEDGQ